MNSDLYSCLISFVKNKSGLDLFIYTLKVASSKKRMSNDLGNSKGRRLSLSISIAFSKLGVTGKPRTVVDLTVMCKMYSKCGIHQLFLKIVLCLLLIRSVELVTGPRHGKLVVCYISSWSIYEKDGVQYKIEHLDPNLCTHVVYIFSILDEAANSIKPSDPSADLDQVHGAGGYRRWTELKKNYPHLKVSLGVGGWNDGSPRWLSLASNEVRRKQFANYVLAYLRQYNFDGIDFNIETPTTTAELRQYKTHFVSLVRDVRQAFRGTGLLITSAINPLPDVIDKAYDIEALTEYVDYFHIKCFDYGGSWGGKVTSISPLRSTNGLGVKDTIDHLLSKGMSPNKMVMAIPFSGRYFKTALQGNFGDTSDPSIGDDSVVFHKICRRVSQIYSGTRVTWDDLSSQSIAKYMDFAENKTVVVVFDGGRSVVKKTRFAIKKGLAGIVAYTIDNDDFMGMCNEERDAFNDFMGTSKTKLRVPSVTPGKHALLKLVNQAIELTLNGQDRSEYFVSLLKLHMEIDDIDPQDANVCYQTANTYLRMLRELLDLHSSNLKLGRNDEL